MKKFKLFIATLSSMFLLTSCTFLESLFYTELSTSENSESSSVDSKPNDPSRSESVTTEESSSETSSESSSSSSSSSSEEKELVLESIVCEDISKAIYTGYSYADQGEFEIYAYYDDNSCEKISPSKVSIKILSVENDSYKYTGTDDILIAGTYKVKAEFKYKENGVTATETISYDSEVLSAFKNDLHDADNFEVTSICSFEPGDIVANKITGTAKFTWEDSSLEYYDFDKNDTEIKTYVYGSDNPTKNVANTALKDSVDYEILVCYEAFEASFNLSFTGAEKLDSKDFPIGYSDIEFGYSSPFGQNKILVVPIALTKGNTNKEAWTTDKLQKLEQITFGDSGRTFDTYYQDVSKGNVSFSGMVTDVYTESSLSVSNINSDYNTFTKLINNAIAWVKTNHKSDINWDEYDLNGDDLIDNVYFTSDYISQNWGSDNLWPHKSTISSNINASKANGPLVYHYFITNSSYVDDVTVAIHEQGHAFGLDDYYDYSGKCDYIGGADMQSHNLLDWNSFSKLSVGWAKPYVVTGASDSVTITIKDAATTNECIIIPANYDTWNGSAFDEYFLIELFSNKGVNTYDWSYWQSATRQSLGDGGIRLYHVDARIFQLASPYGNGKEVDYDDLIAGNINAQISMGPNNSYDYRDYGYGQYLSSSIGDFKLLTLIQAGGQNTFGSTSSSSRKYLNESDLFETGDVFTFSQYSSFLSKSGKKVTTMDNGETFPYTIEFVSVTPDSATVRIYK